MHILESTCTYPAVLAQNQEHCFDWLLKFMMVLIQADSCRAHAAQVRLPLSIGAILSTRRRNGELHLAVVIERRRLADDSEEYDYYMHYEGCASPQLFLA
jgi:hypothetical protein